MACLTLRNIPGESLKNLRVTVKRRGVSLEAFIRDLLVREARMGEIRCENVADLALELFGPRHGTDLQLGFREMLRPE